MQWVFSVDYIFQNFTKGNYVIETYWKRLPTLESVNDLSCLRGLVWTLMCFLSIFTHWLSSTKNPTLEGHTVLSHTSRPRPVTGAVESVVRSTDTTRRYTTCLKHSTLALPVFDEFYIGHPRSEIMIFCDFAFECPSIHTRPNATYLPQPNRHEHVQ